MKKIEKNQLNLKKSNKSDNLYLGRNQKDSSNDE